MKYIFDFRIEGDNSGKHGARHVKIVTQIYHKHTYKLCVKYCSTINDYGNGNSENFEVMSDKFNVHNICT